MAALYTREANRVKLAREAATKLLTERDANIYSRTSASGAGKKSKKQRNQKHKNWVVGPGGLPFRRVVNDLHCQLKLIAAIDPKSQFQNCQLKADVMLLNFDVRFTPESGHSLARFGCPLWAKLRHQRNLPSWSLR
jgi:hypothetical protein